jgi:hypothetical protein
VGSIYSFTPTASDPEGATLRFTISGKPGWATFDSTTGRLRGTPSSSNIGRTGTITIGVTDGVLYKYLPGFTILVSSTAVLGKATLSWVKPTKTSTGATLTGLAGFRIYYGKSSTSLTNRLSLPNPALTSAVIESLDGGRWYFAITAYTTSGSESAKSAIVSKYIG